MSDHHHDEHDSHAHSLDLPTDRATYIIKGSDGKVLSATPLMWGCADFTAGHHLHYIDARAAAECDDWAPVQILVLEGNNISFANESGMWRKWHHDPEHLAELAAAPDLLKATVEWCEPYDVLRVRLGGHARMLSLAEEADGPCFDW